MLSFIEAFILLLVIMDPIVSLTALVSLTRGRKNVNYRRIAVKSVLVAAIVFLVFALGGDSVFIILGVDLNSFRVAGGIILVLLGIRLALGISFPEEKESDISEVAVVIGTPLISGPATITTTMILVKDIGFLHTLAAGTASLALIFIVLLLSHQIERLAGRGGLKVLSTMMGIVTIAWGIKFLMTGVLAFFGI